MRERERERGSSLARHDLIVAANEFHLLSHSKFIAFVKRGTCRWNEAVYHHSASWAEWTRKWVYSHCGVQPLRRQLTYKHMHIYIWASVKVPIVSLGIRGKTHKPLSHPSIHHLWALAAVQQHPLLCASHREENIITTVKYANTYCGKKVHLEDFFSMSIIHKAWKLSKEAKLGR